MGVIKEEVAPIKGAETDEKLGVGEFQSKYFQGFPLFLDQEKKFYSFLSDKSLLSQTCDIHGSSVIARNESSF
eukprot:scaffold5904_cov165-Ochromonas_danica.AAC.3